MTNLYELAILPFRNVPKRPNGNSPVHPTHPNEISINSNGYTLIVTIIITIVRSLPTTPHTPCHLTLSLQWLHSPGTAPTTFKPNHSPLVCSSPFIDGVLPLPWLDQFTGRMGQSNISGPATLNERLLPFLPFVLTLRAPQFLKP